MSLINRCKMRFCFSRISKEVCSYCGTDFDYRDTILEGTSLEGEEILLHDCCLKEMDSDEALNLFGVKVKEVVI